MKTQLDKTTYEQRARVGLLVNQAQSELVAELDKVLMGFDVSGSPRDVLASMKQKLL